MIKVFIVDDEKWVRQSIKHSIAWEEHGFEIASEEDDGLDALGKIMELRPQIVIADIRMPGLDGIELFKMVRMKLPHTLFIFISGYSHFNYVQDALNLGAFNYILKPIDAGKLLEVLLNAKSRTIQLEQNVRDQAMARHSLGMLKNQFLNALLDGTKFAEAALAAKLKQFGLAFPFGGFVALRIAIDNYRSIRQHLNFNDIELMSFSLRNIAAEVIAKYGLIGAMAELPSGELAVVLNVQQEAWEETEPYVRQVAEEIAASVKQYQYFTVTIGMSGLVDELGRLSESNAEAGRSLDYRVELGNDRVIAPSDCKEREDRFDLLPVEEETELLKLLDGLNRPAFNERIDKLFGSLNGSRIRQPLQLGFLFRHICGLIFMMAARKGHSTSHLQEEQRAVHDRAEGMTQADEFRELLKSVADRYLLVADDAGDQGEKSSAVRKMREYVYAHYGEKVDLQVLAGHLYMHPVYLSKIFKQETGGNFTDFLLGYRMSMAKELMRHKAYELSDIARMVGFDDYSYFNKQFRKTQGLSPQEFRKTVEMIP
ncbi:response regulator [Cohnella sp. LGH]|uniref:response regulator transcription factor n=1 Tax=Cohnella sp. LGH TaxID=1619153 RepID=UPI001ADBF29B|nr:response regulator [Cohnella sp. LGH]QTH41601.1 response regulator [Cohnella sp. LGH]